jgi:hypothetical protein
VLFLTYEELTADLECCLDRIIAFCNFEVAPEQVPGILERCSFSFMKKHEARFDPVLETLWENGVRLDTFLRQGRVGEGTTELSQWQEEQFERVLRKQLGQYGLDSDREERMAHRGKHCPQVPVARQGIQRTSVC